MRKTFLIFLIVSIAIHMSLFYFIKIKKPEIKNEKPIFVDIVKKKKDIPQKNDKKKKKILSEKDKILKKKGIEKKTEKIPKKDNNIVERKKLPEKKKKIVIPKKKKIPEKSKEMVKKKEKKGLNLNKQKTVEKKKEKKREEKKQVFDKGKDKKLTKDQVASILNPKSIISKYAEKSEAGSKEGEDDVDVRMMKYKYASYFKKFERRLYQVWHYPRNSAQRGEEGTVKIKFTILKDGTITNIRILQSSGYPYLDKEAVRALKKMKGIPLPDSYGLKRLNVTGYFVYRLNYLFVY
ncbi:energy transducer TonB [Deferribacter abyssi]|uniref:energy transducer TonB n=1 Tax=Deferribacter abyssi TaxID=213806 RepID=UPI003C246776